MIESSLRHVGQSALDASVVRIELTQLDNHNRGIDDRE